MHWYVIHTKPKQEQRALLNLEQQGYVCYLPVRPIEKIRGGELEVVMTPLFSRYLFIQLDTDRSSKSWSPIRSTKGVSHIVAFGAEPAKVRDDLIEQLKRQIELLIESPQQMFNQGERVLVIDGPFAGLEVIYDMNDGNTRAMVFIELLSKTTRLGVSPTNLRKLD